MLCNRIPRRPKILILEDENITAHHLHRILVKLGYEVTGLAASGESALTQLNQSRPDLLLADVGIEGDLDGIAVANRARALWKIPTVFLTAYSDPETMLRARTTEPYGYLVKPFAEQELHATIEIALQQSGLVADLEQQAHATAHLLARTQEELAVVTSRLFNTQEEERRRIARDLHDDLGQRLVLLQLDIERLWQKLPPESQVDTKPELSSALDRMEKLANDVRNISHNLHPQILDHLGLTVALRKLCEDFQTQHAMPTRFACRSVPQEIPPATSVALYRIVQEALHNIAKHAGSATINVALLGGPDGLELSVRDNGAGFDPNSEHARTGLGLITMAERARLAGGMLQIQTQPQHGTQIRVSVPVSRLNNPGPDVPTEPVQS
jgi:signal transduction histidine kinase